MILEFGGTSYDVETQHKLIQDILHEGVVTVEFTKISGELRTMNCTLHRHWMPSEAIREHHQTRLHDPETISVWDTDKQAWRSFKTMRVITAKLLQNDTEKMDS
jgi:hypothetical protein